MEIEKLKKLVGAIVIEIVPFDEYTWGDPERKEAELYSLTISKDGKQYYIKGVSCDVKGTLSIEEE